MYCCKWGTTSKQSASVRYQQQSQRDEQRQAINLNFNNKTKPSCGTGLTVIKYPTCSNTCSLAEMRGHRMKLTLTIIFSVFFLTVFSQITEPVIKEPSEEDKFSQSPKLQSLRKTSDYLIAYRSQ